MGLLWSPVYFASILFVSLFHHFGSCIAPFNVQVAVLRQRLPLLQLRWGFMCCRWIVRYAVSCCVVDPLHVEVCMPVMLALAPASGVLSFSERLVIGPSC